MYVHTRHTHTIVSIGNLNCGKHFIWLSDFPSGDVSHN